MAPEQAQRVAAYALVFDERGRVLLVLAGPADSNMWYLPGGGVDFGEDPQEGVRREVTEETGQVVDQLTLWRVLSDTVRVASGRVHNVRIIYRAHVEQGIELRAEIGGSTVGAQWVPLPEALDLKLAPFARECLASCAPA